MKWYHKAIYSLVNSILPAAIKRQMMGVGRTTVLKNSNPWGIFNWLPKKYQQAHNFEGTPSSNVVVKEQSQAIALKENPYTNWSKELIVKHIGTVEELIEILNSDINKYEKSLTDIDRKIGAAGDDQRLIERIEKSATKTKKELQESKDSLLEHKKELEQLKAALATK
ncbi:hypothetical protein C1I60_22535 [Paenibacillus terrae]|uniref:Uncharacterized protein n=1 Tax=Paenibacillus terrae TaxID=159743 RepID=A0A4U2PRX8_9BACL|nr:hypothetical protein [Paenibacillus terrae]TKH42077.1 hypothetical protein C1I60_22535 [Paenibacillus terrae]